MAAVPRLLRSLTCSGVTLIDGEEEGIRGSISRGGWEGGERGGKKERERV
jgi:hypothetical protein